MRQTVGNLSGIATLVADDQETGPVTYDRDVWHDIARNLKSASGTIRATRDRSFKAMKSMRSLLRTESGAEIEILVVGYADPVADVEVSGPVPGF